MSDAKQLNELVDIFMDFGEAMMDAGAEIGRIEDSLGRMGIAYGAVKTNVFVITSSIELTMIFPDEIAVTRTRRINSAPSVDFEKLRLLNAISRKCANQRLTVEELSVQIEQIRTMRHRKGKPYLGSVLAAGAFTVFFGGNMLDAVISGVFAVFICLLQEKAAKFFPNKIFFLFVCSLVTGVGICAVNYIMPGLHIDKIIIGDIMLLVPGIAITNAVRDTLIGDTISGLVKLSDSLVWAAALAAGFMLAISCFAR